MFFLFKFIFATGEDTLLQKSFTLIHDNQMFFFHHHNSARQVTCMAAEKLEWSLTVRLEKNGWNLIIPMVDSFFLDAKFHVKMCVDDSQYDKFIQVSLHRVAQLLRVTRLHDIKGHLF